MVPTLDAATFAVAVYAFASALLAVMLARRAARARTAGTDPSGPRSSKRNLLTTHARRRVSSQWLSLDRLLPSSARVSTGPLTQRWALRAHVSFGSGLDRGLLTSAPVPSNLRRMRDLERPSRS